MSLRAFARLRGVTLNAVQTAIAGARLTSASVGQDAKGRPVITDPARAMQEWAAHSRPRLANVAAGPGRVSALGLATLRERRARAERLELELGRARRELVPVRDVDHRWSALIVAARTALLGIPSRAKARLPHLTSADVTVLDGLIREALIELAEPPPTRTVGVSPTNGAPPRAAVQRAANADPSQDGPIPSPPMTEEDRQ